MRTYRIIVRLLSLLFAASVAAAALAGCTSSKNPFFMVEVCLHDETGVTAFKEEMQAIARSHGMSLVDDSNLTEISADATTTPEFRRKLARPIISMVVRNGEDVIAIVGNTGLPSGQVAIGFFDGSTFDSQEFSEMVVKRLATKWQVEIVPQGRGAQGIEGCT